MNNELKKTYIDLLNNVNIIISKLDEITSKTDDLSNNLSNNYIINDISFENQIIEKSKIDMHNIKKFLNNDVKIELLECINQYDNNF